MADAEHLTSTVGSAHDSNGPAADTSSTASSRLQLIDPAVWPTNTFGILAQYDDAMEQIAWAAYNWTINDSHLVGLAPWHWYDDGRIGSYSYGVASLPRTQAAYTLISRLLKQAIKTDDSPLTWAGSDGRRKYSNAQDDLATPAAPRFGYLLPLAASACAPHSVEV